MLACNWMDTGNVNMISTVGDSSVEERRVKQKGTSDTGRLQLKPLINLDYIKNMGGVDHFDHLCSSYDYDRKTMKWYQVIWHFIKEAALVNGRIHYNIQNKDKLKKTITSVQYRQKIITKLTEGFTRKQKKRAGRKSTGEVLNRLVERHSMLDLSLQKGSKYRPNCKVCSIINCKRKGKEGACKRKQTRFLCKQCPNNPAMCVDPCFGIYHNVKDYKKRCKCL